MLQGDLNPGPVDLPCIEACQMDLAWLHPPIGMADVQKMCSKLCMQIVQKDFRVIGSQLLLLASHLPFFR